MPRFESDIQTILQEKNDLLQVGVMEDISVELGLDELLLEDVQVGIMEDVSVELG
jgi:hypothetical protein